MVYWAVIWGTIIMGVTGLGIWFKMDVTKFLPRWAVDVAGTVHYYESILACLAVVVWDFYHVIFDVAKLKGPVDIGGVSTTLPAVESPMVIPFSRFTSTRWRRWFFSGWGTSSGTISVLGFTRDSAGSTRIMNSASTWRTAPRTSSGAASSAHAAPWDVI